MSNHSHNTITITGPEAELRKFSAAHPLVNQDNLRPNPEIDFYIDKGSGELIANRPAENYADHDAYALGYDLVRDTNVSEWIRDGKLVSSLGLVYHSWSSWTAPVEKILALSVSYPALEFDLTNNFLPGEGDWLHVFIRNGKYRGRCPGDLQTPCPENDNCGDDGGKLIVIYDHWWEYCENHKVRWSWGDASGLKHHPSLQEQEQAFNLLGGVASVPWVTGHGWLDYSTQDCYRDADERDRAFWRATVIHRRRLLARNPDACAKLNLSVEEIGRLVREAAEEVAHRKGQLVAAEEWRAKHPMPDPTPDDDLPF